MLLSTEETLQLINRYNIPYAKTIICKTLDDLLLAASRIAPPFVLKIYSPDISHKTDVGGVMTGIRDVNELKEAYKKILSNVRSKMSDAKIEGVLLQQQLDGLETIIGGKHDATFGKIILFGLGGVFTEVFEDVAIRVVPISKRDAEEIVKEIKGYKILKGYRGKVYNLKALVELLLKTSKLLQQEEIKELDFNPVIVNEKEAKVVDWRIYV